jgi:hypothetical protein
MVRDDLYTVCCRNLKRLRFFIALTACAVCPAAHAQVPRVTSLYPPGIQRGRSATLLLSGDGLEKESRLLSSAKGLTFHVLEASKDGHSMGARVEASKDTPPGVHEVRVIGSKGASNARFFEVGAFPEAQEKEPNDGEGQGMELSPAPVTVSGRVTPADRDSHKVKAGAGETWVFRLSSSPLGSPLDGSLTLRDAKGREIGSAVQLPEVAPCIAHTFTEAQEVTVTVRDLKYAGGDDYLYRLTVGPVPLVKYPLPLGVTRGKSTKVHWEGVNLQGIADKEVTAPGDSLDEAMEVWPGGPDSGAPPVRMPVSSWPELRKTAPIPSRTKAMPLDPLPVAVSGVIGRAGESDYFRITAPPSGKLNLEVFSRRWGSRMDPVLRVTDLSGKEGGANDDAEGKDSRLALDVTPGQVYFVSVGDLPGGGGGSYFYRLVFTTTPVPDVTLRAYPDTVNFGQRGTAVVRVYADRKDGFNGDVGVNVVGLPEGVTASSGVIRSGTDSLPVTLTASPQAVRGGFVYRIEGSAAVGDQAIRRTAQPVNTPDRVSQSPISPPPLQFQLLGIGDAPAFTLALEREEVSVKPGESATLTFKLNRKPGEGAAVMGEVTLETEGAPQGWTIESPTVPADKSEGTITFKVPAEAPAGAVPLIVYARNGDQRLPAPLLWVKVDKG